MLTEAKDRFSSYEVGVPDAGETSAPIVHAGADELFPIVVVIFIIVGNIIRFLAKSRESRGTPEPGQPKPSSPPSTAEDELRRFLEELTGGTPSPKPTPKPRPAPPPLIPQPAGRRTASELHKPPPMPAARAPASPPPAKRAVSTLQPRSAQTQFTQRQQGGKAATRTPKKPSAPSISRTSASVLPSKAVPLSVKRKPIKKPRSAGREAGAAFRLPGSRESLQQAIVLKEILGTPAALRQGYGHQI